MVSNNLTALPIYLWGASSGGTLALKMMGQLYRLDQEVRSQRPARRPGQRHALCAPELTSGRTCLLFQAGSVCVWWWWW